MASIPLVSLLILSLAATMLAIPAFGEIGKGNPQNVEVLLVVDGKRVGETWINLSPEGRILEIPSAPVVSALGKFLTPQAIRTLETRITKDGLLLYPDLVASGVDATFNATSSQLTLRMARRPSDAKTAANEGKSAFPAAENTSSSIPKTPDSVKPSINSGPWTSPPLPGLPGANDAYVASVPNDTGPDKIEMVRQQVPPPISPVAAVPEETGPEAPTTPQLRVESQLMDQSRDELYQEVFKRKAPPAPSKMEVSLMVGGKDWGTIWIDFDKDRSGYEFPADLVLKALQGSINRESWEKLAKLANSLGRLTPKQMEACGFPTELDESQFELNITIPAQSLGVQVHYLSRSVSAQAEESAIKPNRFSAYLNGHLKQRLNYYQNTYDPLDSLNLGQSLARGGNDHIRQPALADLEGAVNVAGWVFEGHGVWRESYRNTPHRFDRREMRIVHDWPRSALRLTLGDLNFSSTGYQNFVKTGGIGISKVFSLQPNMVAYPVRDFEFFLANPSEVKVYINGRLTSVLNLSQGTHDIQGFPFVQGESDVVVEITDNTGQMQKLSFNFIHETSLLAKGITRYSYNVGLPSRDAAASRIPKSSGSDEFELLGYGYDRYHPVFYASYQFGLLDVLTPGAYAQATDTAGMIGLNTLLATKIGKFQAEVAGSYQESGDQGLAASLDYTYITRSSSQNSPISWRAKAEYISEGFSYPRTDSLRMGSTIFSGSVRKSMRPFVFSANGSYSIRKNGSNFYGISGSIGRNWMRGLNSNFSVKNIFDQQKITNTRVSATLSYTFHSGYHNLIASERVETHRNNYIETNDEKRWDNYTDLRWDYKSGAPFPINPNLSAVSNFGPIYNEFQGLAGWKSGQGTADIGLRRLEPAFAGSSPIQQNYADFNLNAALVYVDGNFAFSRPIRNSFLLVKGIKSDKDCDIIINPNPLGYDAKSKPFLPGVVPSMSAYSVTRVNLEQIAPPIGAAEEETEFKLFPTYKSGFALYLGSDATAIGLGTLFVEPGIPAEYLTFTAVPVSGTEKDAILGFTNSAGKFQLPKLKPGSYRISVDVNGKEKVAQFRLPDEASGLFGLGSLILEDP